VFLNHEDKLRTASPKHFWQVDLVVEEEIPLNIASITLSRLPLLNARTLKRRRRRRELVAYDQSIRLQYCFLTSVLSFYLWKIRLRFFVMSKEKGC
jgi:hypothetical protein